VRFFLARNDPRRQTASIGIYTHVRDRWGISYAQPILLNERLETSLLAVDTHGYTDVAMAIAKLLGFDLCPRLQALKDRHLFLPHGSDCPEILRSICHANMDLAKITAQ
jgi:TnpA family transposase